MDTDSIEMGSIASLKSPETKQSEHTGKQTNVDRGYAWVVMLAVFGTLLCQGPMGSVHTIVYQEYLVRFNINAATAGWILGLPSSIRMLSSPAVGLLYQKFSHRTVAMTGTLVFSAGLLTTGFATSMRMLYTGAVLFGIGGNMFVMSSFIMVPLYFSRRRGTAMAFSLCGGTIGGIIFPPLFTRSFSTFGFTQTLVFMSCVTIQTFATTSLYRPQTVVKDDINSDTATKSICQTCMEKSGVNLLARPVLVFYMIVVASLHVILAVRAIFLSGLAFECISGVTKNEIATMLSIAAIGAFVKLPLGFCSDLQFVRPYRMYWFGVLAIVAGLLGIALPFMTNKITFTICFVVCTVLLAGAHSQYVNVLAEVVKIEQLSSALALTRTVVGIALLFGAPSVGKIKDVTNSFKYGFILVNTIHICIVTGYLVVYFCWTRCKKRSKQCAKTEDPSA